MDKPSTLFYANIILQLRAFLPLRCKVSRHHAENVTLMGITKRKYKKEIIVLGKGDNLIEQGEKKTEGGFGPEVVVKKHSCFRK